MGHAWIEKNLTKLVQRNQTAAATPDLQRALEGEQMFAMVVSLNLKQKDGKLKIGLQLFDPDNDDMFRWKGFY